MPSVRPLLPLLTLPLLAGAGTAGARPVDSIEHIVIFMQENRAFDHYFGSLQGVRGFADRAALPLQNGLNSFYQPVSQDTAAEANSNRYIYNR
jgi:phospholipase C